MIDAAKLDEIEKGLEGVTEGPWAYRPELFDDWGIVRSAPDEEGRKRIVAAVRMPYVTTAEANAHRNAGTDPWQKSAAHIARMDPTTVRELVRLARIGMDLEQGREQYVRGFRVHVPIGEPGDF